MNITFKEDADVLEKEVYCVEKKALNYNFTILKKLSIY